VTPIAFVGAGPGDPRLVTVRGADLLRDAEVVMHDARVHPMLLDLCPPSCARLGLGGPTLAEPEARAARLVALAREGKRVVRLFEGDPLTLAAGDEEIVATSRLGAAFEVVPGVLHAVALGAYAGIALSRASDAAPSVAIADTRPGPTLHDWSKLANSTDTLVLVSDPANVVEIGRTLVFSGRSPEAPAAVVCDLSLPTQETRTGALENLGHLAKDLGPGPLLIVVGTVAGKREALSWFDNRPLFGKRVLVMRALDQAPETAALLYARGADPIVVPTLEIVPPSDVGLVARTVVSMDRYDWVAFTSANGVERTWSALLRAGRDARAFGKARIAAIGPATAAALERHGLVPDVTAKEFKGEGLAAAMQVAMAGAIQGKGRFLILRAERARDVLPDALRAAGAVVDIVPVYATRAPEGIAETLRELLEKGAVDAAMFSSSSTVTHVCDALGESAARLLSRVRVASIGPVTSETARKRGLRVDVEAATYTLPALVDALETNFDARG
jgi:uroporphyrinogen III methyltransferase/synthase